VEAARNTNTVAGNNGHRNSNRLPIPTAPSKSVSTKELPIPHMDHIPHDIGIKLYSKLLGSAPGTLSDAEVRKAIIEARIEMQRRDLAFSLRTLAKDCLADCSVETRKQIRLILSAFDELDKQK